MQTAAKGQGREIRQRQLEQQGYSDSDDDVDGVFDVDSVNKCRLFFFTFVYI